MPLLIYREDDFSQGSQIDFSDTFTGDGVTTDFVLVNKTTARLGGTVQFGATQYEYADNGFIKIPPDTFETNSAPPLSSSGVAPGLLTLLFDNLFDQDEVDGIVLSREQEIPAWMLDKNTINNYKYTGVPSLGGIQITMVNAITGLAAQTSWVQLACAAPDGTALTYGATGAPLLTGDLTAFGTVLTTYASAGATSVLVDNASGFTLGDYVLINAGQANQEIIQVLDYSPPTTLDISGFNFNHTAGETMYACGRKFWLKCTVPLDATSGAASNFYNLLVRHRFVQKSRA